MCDMSIIDCIHVCKIHLICIVHLCIIFACATRIVDYKLVSITTANDILCHQIDYYLYMLCKTPLEYN